MISFFALMAILLLRRRFEVLLLLLFAKCRAVLLPSNGRSVTVAVADHTQTVEEAKAQVKSRGDD